MQSLPAAVEDLLNALVPAIRDSLTDNFVGAYIGGSLATGSYDALTSDVDVLVVTERPVSDAEITVLAAVHERIPLERDGERPEYEVYYIDRDTIRRFEPGQQHVKAEPGYGVYRTDHRPSWVIERQTVREHGITLAGPDPRELIDPVAVPDIKAASLGELRARLENWDSGVWPRSDLENRGSQGYEIDTACRALLAVETGELASKSDAVAWARSTVPEAWHPLLDFADRYRKQWTPDASHADAVLAFVRYVLERGSMSSQ